MAKASMIARENKRAKFVEKFAAKRAQLKSVLSDSEASDDEKWAAQVKLQKLPSLCIRSAVLWVALATQESLKIKGFHAFSLCGQWGGGRGRP